MLVHASKLKQSLFVEQAMKPRGDLNNRIQLSTGRNFASLQVGKDTTSRLVKREKLGNISFPMISDKESPGGLKATNSWSTQNKYEFC